jgi:hypothetical protein
MVKSSTYRCFPSTEPPLTLHPSPCHRRITRKTSRCPRARTRGRNPALHARPKHRPPLITVRCPRRSVHSVHSETIPVSFAMSSSSSWSKPRPNPCSVAPGPLGEPPPSLARSRRLPSPFQRPDPSGAPQPSNHPRAALIKSRHTPLAWSTMDPWTTGPQSGAPPPQHHVVSPANKDAPRSAT